MFTLMIAKKPVAVIDAPEPAVRELMDDAEFQDDLTELLSDGKPLWNGTDLMTIRPSTEDEVEQFEQGNFDGEEDEDDDEEGTTVYFLVAIDEIDEDEED